MFLMGSSGGDVAATFIQILKTVVHIEMLSYIKVCLHIFPPPVQ